MPEPVPEPTAEQLVIVAEITRLSTATVTTMIAVDDQDIANAKWDRTLEDIEAWPAIRDETGDTKKIGPLEFFDTSITTRLAFRNRVRSRYGQLLLIADLASVSCGSSSAAITVTADW